MSDRTGLPGDAAEDRDWYSLRDVARVLGLSRQAVHARVRKGQLEADLIDGLWQVPGAAVAAAVQTQRKRALSMGSVRLLPMPTGGNSGTAGEDVTARLDAIERVVLGLREEHRQALAERELEVAALQERCARLQTALHQMVDLLGSGGPSERTTARERG